MKYQNWKKQFNNEEEIRQFFKDNITNNRVPVSISWCPKCDEILYDYPCKCGGLYEKELIKKDNGS